MSGSLEGRAAIVTGAGAGIGAATARLLAGRGARVTVADIDAANGDATAAAIVAAGGEAIAVAADVSDETAINRVVERTVDRWNRVDIVVNNAAPLDLLDRDVAIEGADREVWERMLGVCLLGTVWLTQQTIPHLRAAGGGSIVNLTSAAGLAGSRKNHAYNAAKAALISVTQSLATAYGDDGIRCNAVAPGFVVHTEPVSDDDVATRRAWSALSPIGDIGCSDDIAEAIGYLVSDAARFVTGQVLSVDGGLLAYGPWTSLQTRTGVTVGKGLRR